MATMTSQNPISDLTYDWLTILQNKAEAVTAYEKYLQDAESANSPECVEMLKKLHGQETRMLQEIKDHVFGMIAKEQGGR